MKWSLQLGKVSGIAIYIHWTFLILIGWVLMMHFQMGHGLSDALVGLGFVLAIFVCVTLHELGHALTAKKFRIVTKNITLLPIGGLANMERLPEKPRQELLVALAGPAVNVVIALLLFVYLSLSDKMPSFSELETMEHHQELMSGSNFLFNLMTVNIILAVFNLIPAFPMDGGRVLRALLAYKLDRAKATRIAASIGQLLAILFVFAGFFSNFWLVFIGFFIYIGAGSEAAFEKTKSLLEGHKIREVMMRDFTPFHPFDRLEKVIQKMLDSQEKNFLVVEKGSVIGVVTLSEIIKGTADHGKDVPLSQLMNREFISLQTDSDLESAYLKMKTEGHVMCPVIENGTLVGMVDEENISEWLMLQKYNVHGQRGLAST